MSTEAPEAGVGEEGSPLPPTVTPELVELDPELIDRAGAAGLDLMVLPTRVADGVGVYPEAAVTAVKELRADNEEAAFLDDTSARTFECKNSALSTAVVSFAIGFASNAAWAGTARLLRRRPTKHLTVTALDLRPDSPTRGLAWKATGETEDVIRSIERLALGDHALSGPSADAEAPNADFPEAGADTDLHDAYLEQQVRDRRDAADALMRRAKAFMRKSAHPKTLRRAEGDARRALALYRGALDWAEDGPLEDDAHSAMDGAGRWVRRTFGCHLKRDGNSYSQECPVALGHTRIGFSVGGTVAVRLCSICGLDLSECEHLPGRSYLVPGGMSELGWCRVCAGRECNHSPEQTERARVIAIVTEMAVDEVSLVSKPAHPEARIQASQVSIEALKARLGDSFVPGQDVSCDQCLHPCGGLDRPELPHG